jgi:hypothetical protein
VEEIQINEADPEALVRFLEKDPFCFRSGYMKERYWRLLKRLSLTETQKKRLRKVAIAYLDKPMSREFWQMCRFVWTIADEPFRHDINRLTKSKDTGVQQRAAFLSAYLESPEQGAAVRNEFRRAVREANLRRYYERLNQKK